MANEDEPRAVPVKIVEMPSVNTDAVEREIEEIKIARVLRAEGVEEERKTRAEGLEGERATRAEGLETNRLERELNLERSRSSRAARVSKQMIVLAAFFVVVSIIMSVRSEINSADIQKTQDTIVQAQYDAKVATYQACLQSAERTTKINPGRAALVELFVQLVDESTLDDTKKADARKLLNDGLVVPPLDCGKAPVK